jgi:hypothetical protein
MIFQESLVPTLAPPDSTTSYATTITETESTGNFNEYARALTLL